MAESPWFFRVWRKSHAEDRELIWEIRGKGVRQNLKPNAKNKTPSLTIELYNLKDDIAETKDVASEQPDIITQMEQLMREQHTPSAVFPLPALDRLVAK